MTPRHSRTLAVVLVALTMTGQSTHLAAQVPAQQKTSIAEKPQAFPLFRNLSRTSAKPASSQPVAKAKPATPQALASNQATAKPLPTATKPAPSKSGWDVVTEEPQAKPGANARLTSAQSTASTAPRTNTPPPLDQPTGVATNAPRVANTPRATQKSNAQAASSIVYGKIERLNSSHYHVFVKFPAGQAPAAGSTIKVYHEFLLGTECVGALEVIGTNGHLVTTRPVGTLSLSKLAVGDRVSFLPVTTIPVVSQGMVTQASAQQPVNTSAQVKTPAAQPANRLWWLQEK